MALIILCTVLATAPSMAQDDARYRIGLIYNLGNLRAAEAPKYTFNHGWGILLGTAGRPASFSLSLLSQKNHTDSTVSGHFGFFADPDLARLAFKSLRVGVDLNYRLSHRSRLSPTVDIGLGYIIWEFLDPSADTVLKAAGEKDYLVDFSASEMYLSGGLGLDYQLSPSLNLHAKASLDYLSSIGTAFSDSINDIRGRTIMRAGISLSYLFGGNSGRREKSDQWKSSTAWTKTPADLHKSSGARDSDGDGTGDKDDRCPDTPPGVYTDINGCPLDGDRDGVYDGLDDCPGTPPTARGYIDLFGCPIDSDFDGVADYLDSCRQGPIGAIVDNFGCPVDSDSDGVFDGLDDCPYSVPGIEVDQRGCIDITFLRDTMRIHIDYQPGSFEIDERTRRRLGPLITKLVVLDHVRVRIIGYTDNVGPSEANHNLSEKRANRMRDWLVSKGIDADRLTSIGRGETNFIASNQTADGRAQNRRIELIFLQ